jgi:2-polyprenyl-3-methyl-5-hydroxy-6-metoxy-1,4-benzoquinol methylase
MKEIPTMPDDGANGYEQYAEIFMRARNSKIGPSVMRKWASQLEPGSELLELGCGHGVISQVLLQADLHLSVVDPSPTLLRELHDRFPDVEMECSTAQASKLLSRKYDGVVAWGLIFLLAETDQRSVLRRAADALRPGGRLVFTAPSEALTWKDSITEMPSLSLGATVYEALLRELGLHISPGVIDEGDNFYYEAIKPS